MQFVELIKASAKERGTERRCLRVGGGGYNLEDLSILSRMDGSFFSLYIAGAHCSGVEGTRAVSSAKMDQSLPLAAAALAWAVQAQQTNAGHTHPSALLYKSS